MQACAPVALFYVGFGLFMLMTASISVDAQPSYCYPQTGPLENVFPV